MNQSKVESQLVAEYSGLTDLQICIMESLKTDGPGCTADLQFRLSIELAGQGVPQPRRWTKKEVQHAVDGLVDLRKVGWLRGEGKWTAQLDLPLSTVVLASRREIPTFDSCEICGDGDPGKVQTVLDYLTAAVRRGEIKLERER